MRRAIGLDIGGTNVKAVAVDETGRVLARAATSTTPREVPAGARAALEELLPRLGGRPDALGVCSPGLVARDGLSVAHAAGKLDIEGLEWGNVLGWPAGVPVLNDAHAALLGEAWTGAARELSDIVMLTLGTGVGGAVMVGGRLLVGQRGLAGALGHVSLDPDGPPSIFNTPGSLEGEIGDASVRERSEGRFESTRALVAAHLEGDEAAGRVWLRSVRALAAAVAGFVNVFDPERVVLGGGVAAAGPALFEPLRDALERWEYRPDGQGVPVVPAVLGEDAGAVGAARRALFAQGTGGLS